MGETLKLGTLDWTVLLTYLVLLAGIGWYAARNTGKTTSDYFLAGRSIPWLITTASFMATIISALTFIGSPGEGYSADYRYLFSNIGDILAVFFIALVFLPRFQHHGVTSIYELISIRFGQGARTVCSAFFLVTRMFASAVRIVVVAKVLEVVTGGALSYTLCVAITMGCILAYTTFGGGRAIAWTDLLQFILLMTGAFTALFVIIGKMPGGVSQIIEIGSHAVNKDGETYNKFNFLEMFKPANLNVLLLMAVWGFFQSSAAYGTDQDMVQRLLACNNPRKAGWSLMLSGIISIPVSFIFLSIGVCLYAYAQIHPEWVAGMTDTDHVFPRFILHEMPDGIRGLLLAAVAATAMGSSDSALAALSTSFVIDFYKPFFGKHSDEATCVKVSKIAFVLFGFGMFLCALAFHRWDNVLWLGFRMVSYTYGPLLGIFLVAILTRWRVCSRVLVPLMISISCILITMGIIAWKMTSEGATTGFWFDMHTTYWKFNVLTGAFLIPIVSFFFRQKDKEPTTT